VPPQLSRPFAGEGEPLHAVRVAGAVRAVGTIRGRVSGFVFADTGQKFVYPSVDFATERPFLLQGFREGAVFFPHLGNDFGGTGEPRVFFAQILILLQQIADPAFKTIKEFKFHGGNLLLLFCPDKPSVAAEEFFFLEGLVRMDAV
jgi:hypothetical protein